MSEACRIIRECLEAGMTTNKSIDHHDYYVKTWFVGDPTPINDTNLPAGVVDGVQPEIRETVFVGQDTATETVSIKFFTKRDRRAEEEINIAPGHTRLDAMVDRALQLLRTDPVFGCKVVTSTIEVNRNAGAPGTSFRVAEITARLQRRVLWGD